MAMDDSGNSNEGNANNKKNNYDISEKDLRKRFLALGKKDKYGPALITARAALRVFPLLATTGSFDFWGEQTINENSSGVVREDNRVKYLIAVFLLSKSPVDAKSWEDNYLSEKMKAIVVTAQKATDVSEAIGEDYQGAYDAYCEALTTIDATNAINAYVYAVVAFSRLYAHERPNNVRTELSSDLFFLEKGNSLSDLPLWHNSPPESIVSIYRKKFIPAVKQLAEETKDRNSKKALNKILQEYEELLGEKPNSSPDKIETTVADSEVVNETHR